MAAREGRGGSLERFAGSDQPGETMPPAPAIRAHRATAVENTRSDAEGRGRGGMRAIITMCQEVAAGGADRTHPACRDARSDAK